MSTLQPAGPAAEQIAHIWWVMLGGSILILVSVIALALYATFRPTKGRPESQHRWLLVGGGLVFTPFVLLVLLLYGLRSGHALLPLPTDRDGGGKSATPTVKAGRSTPPTRSTFRSISRSTSK